MGAGFDLYPQGSLLRWDYSDSGDGYGYCWGARVPVLGDSVTTDHICLWVHQQRAWGRQKTHGARSEAGGV